MELFLSYVRIMLKALGMNMKTIAYEKHPEHKLLFLYSITTDCAFANCLISYAVAKALQANK